MGSQLPVELVSHVVQSQRSLCRWLVLKMCTLVHVVVPPLLETLPRQPSKLSVAPAISLLLTCGRKRIVATTLRKVLGLFGEKSQTRWCSKRRSQELLSPDLISFCNHTENLLFLE